MVEATGRREYELVCQAADRHLPIIIVNPLYIHRFAGAAGILAKTDKVDGHRPVCRNDEARGTAARQQKHT